MSTEKIKTAVVGLGMFGALHAQAYTEHPLSELQAVVSGTASRAQELGDRFSVRWYTKVEDMLQREKELDAVSIVNRDADHRRVAIACARAGKHILLEKPMAPTLQEADEIIEAVEKAGVTMMVNFSRHFSPPFIAGYERLRAGEIGQVESMFARRHGTIAGARHYGQWSDMLISTGIHDIDTMVWYAGCKVKRVYGESEKRLTQGLKGDDVYMALLRFEDGAIGSLECSWILPANAPAKLRGRWGVIGTNGAIYIGGVNESIAIIADKGYTHPDISMWPVLHGRVEGTLRRAIDHFLTCLVERRKPIVGAAEGRYTLQLVLAIQESCRTGKVVEVT
ncbi:MAG: Gfo/Idh/MocA family protein [Anaerolineae bacterium]